jgi:ferredoxin
MKATVDADACTGCGLCIDACPEVFEMGDEGVAVVKVTEVSPDDEDSCKEAADGCPVEAIQIEE